MPESTFTVVVAGGGTAGHIEPAMAVAEELRSRGAVVAALGTERGLERDLVPDHGIELRLIPPVPIPRKLTPALLSVPGRVLDAVRAARAILDDISADLVIGFGGYVAAPAYLAARWKGIPFFVHEANARAGMANKLGVRLGGRGFNAVPDSGMPGEVIGIPIRAELARLDRDEGHRRARELWPLNPDRPILLVTGGSQGAASLNRAVAGARDRILAEGFQILHAFGRKNQPPSAADGYVPVPYINDMAAAYSVADLVMCRSGAMTVAEVTACGLPALYVPLPHGNGEQGLNVRAVVAAGGAKIVPDDALDSDRLVAEVTSILGAPEELRRMRAAVSGAATVDAASRIAEAALGYAYRTQGRN